MDSRVQLVHTVVTKKTEVLYSHRVFLVKNNYSQAKLKVTTKCFTFLSITNVGRQTSHSSGSDNHLDFNSNQQN